MVRPHVLRVRSMCMVMMVSRGPMRTVLDFVHGAPYSCIERGSSTERASSPTCANSITLRASTAPGNSAEPPGTGGGSTPIASARITPSAGSSGDKHKREKRDGRFVQHRVGQCQNRTDKHLWHDGGKQMRHRDAARADAERAALRNKGTRKDGAHLGT